MKLLEILYLEEKVNPETKRHLRDILTGLGFTEFKKWSDTSKKVEIVTHLPRNSVFRTLLDNLNGSVRDTDIPGSSAGGVRWREFQILVKPTKFQGSKSAGKENEKTLLDAINKRTDNNSSPISVEFKSPKKTIKIYGVTGAEEVSEKTKEIIVGVKMSRKADIDLTIDDGTKVPISIKQKNAEYYDTSNWMIERLKPTLRRLVADDQISFNKTDKGSNVYAVSPPRVAFEATDEEATQALLYPDIQKNYGAIITSDFTPGNMGWNEEERKLSIDVKSAIADAKDIRQEVGKIYFVFANHADKSSPGLADVIPGAPEKVKGIFVRAMPSKAIQSTTKVISVSERA